MKCGRINDFTISIFDIMNYLLIFSSQEHKLSVQEITYNIMIIREEYGNSSGCFLEDHEITRLMEGRKYNRYCSRDEVDPSMRRQVSRLIEKYLNRPLIYGLCIRSEGGKFYRDSFVQAYYAEHLFSDSHINMIRSFICTLSCAETEEVAAINDNLNMIVPLYDRVEYDDRRFDSYRYRGSYFVNLDIITKALSRVRSCGRNEILSKNMQDSPVKDYEKMYTKRVNQISFKYCYYDDELKLQVYPDRYGKETRIANPVKLVWQNGCCLESYAPDRNELDYYRVDRMIDVQCLDSEAAAPCGMRVRKTNAEITVKCGKTLINSAVDTFGIGIDVEKADSRNVIISLKSDNYDKMKMWALGYGAEIISPSWLRREAANTVRELANKY